MAQQQKKQEFQRQPRRKYCQFCKEETEYIDYKDVQLLRKFMTDRGKIKPRRVTGACTQHQHDIAVAIKRARVMALRTISRLPSSAPALWRSCPTPSPWSPAAVAAAAAKVRGSRKNQLGHDGGEGHRRADQGACALERV